MKNDNLDLILELIRQIEKQELMVRIQPSESGHTYNVGK